MRQIMESLQRKNLIKEAALDVADFRKAFDTWMKDYDTRWRSDDLLKLDTNAAKKELYLSYRGQDEGDSATMFTNFQRIFSKFGGLVKKVEDGKRIVLHLDKIEEIMQYQR